MKTVYHQGVHVFHPRPEAEFRLLCFSNAGGDGMSYRSWGRRLAPHVEVGAVCLPGRGIRAEEPLCHRLSEILDLLERETLPFLNKPFAFFGHSLGGLIAFEFARRLRMKGHTLPRYLFVAACNAPHWDQRPNPSYYQLNDEQLLAKVKDMGGFPDYLEKYPDFLDLLLKVLRADLEAMETYRYQAENPLECPVMAFGGLEDPIVEKQALVAWQKQSRQGFQYRLFPGDHFFVQKYHPEFFEVLNKKIASCL